MRRIQRTLEALAVHGSHQPTPGAGRLSEDLEPPGFEALSGLTVGPAAPRGAPESRTRPETSAGADECEPTAAEVQALRRRAHEARMAHEAARRLRELAARERARAERALGEAETELRKAQSEEASAQERAEAAAQALRGAEQARRVRE